jgi:hypothetical protein
LPTEAPVGIKTDALPLPVEDAATVPSDCAAPAPCRQVNATGSLLPKPRSVARIDVPPGPSLGDRVKIEVTEKDDPARPVGEPPTPSTACEPMCAAGTTKLTEPLPE